MNRLITILFAILWLSSPCPGFSAEPTAIQFLRNGPLPASDVPKNLDGWLGLYTNGDKHELVPVTLTTKNVELGQGDGGHIKVQAVLVTGTSKESIGEPLFMVRGSGFKKGVVKESWPIKYPDLNPGEKRTFTIGSRNYEIRSEGSEVGENFIEYINHRLVLVLAEKEQVLVEPLVEPERWNENNLPYIEWVGDIDRDGKLDLLFVHHGVYRDTSLYLSSVAKNDLVTEAAIWRPEMEGFYAH